MLKYLNPMVVFAEIPDEVSLAIPITNCPHRCEGCHSPELHKDIGKDLTQRTLQKLIQEQDGFITCVCFMGGDSEPNLVDMLAEVVHNCGLKVGWYSGNDRIHEAIHLKNFDYIKIGPYIKEKGSLDNPNTNQKLYKIDNESLVLHDITSKLWSSKIS